MILLDSNIFMYAAGSAHSHKAPCMAFLADIAGGKREAGIDAEVLQEVLHRYRAIGRWRVGRLVYDQIRKMIPAVLPITHGLLDKTRMLLDDYPDLAARDALHAAVYREIGAEAFFSYDRDFDKIRGLKRREPPRAR